MTVTTGQAGINGRRDVLRDSTDLRAVRTRKQIADALDGLARRKVEVTVSSLVREAGVSRGTFYTHYSGLDELAGELQAAIVHRIAHWERQRAHADPGETVLSRRESIAEALRMLVDHYAEYKLFYAAIFSLPTSLVATNVLVDALADELREHMLIDARIPDGVDASIASLFIAGGWMAVISEWVMGRLEASGAAVAAHLVSLVPEWMYQLRGAVEE